MLLFELFGKQDEDAVVCNVISRMVLLNKNIFRRIKMECDTPIKGFTITVSLVS